MPVFFGTATIGLVVFLLSLLAILVQSTPLAAIKEISIQAGVRLILLGVSAWAIEFGYLMLYKAQAPLSLSRVVIMSATGLLLLAIGVWYLREDISKFQISGVVVILLGLALLTVK